MAWELDFRRFPPPDGPLAVAEVPWDSELFGFPIYELRCPEAFPDKLAEMTSRLLPTLSPGQRALAYVKLPVGDVERMRALTAAGFYLVEAGLEYELELDRMRPVWGDRPSGLQMRLGRAEDLPTLQALASGGLANDRYHMDRRVPAERADLRFERWVEYAIRDGDVTLLFESERDGEAIGFVQYRPEPRQTAYMSLISVRESYKHSGLGMIMMEAALRACGAHGFRRVTARSTLNNTDVVRMCSAFGFQITRASYTLHWFRDEVV